MTTSLAVLVTAFLASTVESVEAFAIILAAGIHGGWRSALAGSGTAIVALILAVVLAQPLLARIPTEQFKGIVGAFLLLLGVQWLHKGIVRVAMEKVHRRHANASAVHDDIRDDHAAYVGFQLAFQGTLLEGTEVVLIVIAASAVGGRVLPAATGAVAAAIIVFSIGAALHRPLRQLPESMIKLLVGIALCSLGTLWTTQAMGYAWPTDPFALLFIIGTFTAGAVARAADIHTVSVHHQRRPVIVPAAPPAVLIFGGVLAILGITWALAAHHVVLVGYVATICVAAYCAVTAAPQKTWAHIKPKGNRRH